MIILRDVFFLYFKSQIEFLPYVFCVIEMIIYFKKATPSINLGTILVSWGQIPLDLTAAANFFSGLLGLVLHFMENVRTLSRWES